MSDVPPHGFKDKASAETHHGDRRRRHLFPLGQPPLVHLLQTQRIGQTSLFLQVPYEPVCGFRADHVGEEEEVEEYALGAEDHGSEEDRGLFDRHEGPANVKSACGVRYTG